MSRCRCCIRVCSLGALEENGPIDSNSKPPTQEMVPRRSAPPLAVLSLLVVLAVVAGVVAASPSSPRPFVLMHGLFANAEAMTHIQQWLEAEA